MLRAMASDLPQLLRWWMAGIVAAAVEPCSHLRTVKLGGRLRAVLLA
jgi:hypothetical protein